MDILALIIEALKLFVAAVLLWYLVEYLPVPERIKRAVQIAIALICVLTAISLVAVPVRASSGSAVTPSHPLSPAHPSIIK